jgi:hypothetical protein
VKITSLPGVPWTVSFPAPWTIVGLCPKQRGAAEALGASASAEITIVVAAIDFMDRVSVATRHHARRPRVKATTPVTIRA